MNSKERLLWLEIRRKISENEIREAELRLDKQREQGLLDSQKQQLAELQTNLESGERSRLKFAAEANDLRKKLQEANEKQMEADEECKMLAKQIADLKSELQELKNTVKEEQSFFSCHIKEQEELISQWSGFLQN